MKHRKCHATRRAADQVQRRTSIIDSHPGVAAFTKNAGLGFAIPYLHNGQPHDYVPDFIVRLKTDPAVHLILETKGFDELAEVKAAAAERWVTAVNADEQYGHWAYAMARKISQVREILDGFAGSENLAARLGTFDGFPTGGEVVARRRRERE